MSLMICSEGVFAVPDFCLIFAPRLATMSQKSSFPHPTDSVQYVLTSNTQRPANILVMPALQRLALYTKLQAVNFFHQLTRRQGLASGVLEGIPDRARNVSVPGI